MAEMTPIIVDSRTEFDISRSSAWTRALLGGALGTTVAALMVGLIALAIFLFGGSSQAIAGTLWALRLLPLWFALSVGYARLAVRRIPAVQVTPAGIRAPNFWNRYLFVKWEDVVDVKPYRYLGVFPYLLLSVDYRDEPLWVALDLERPEQFRHAVLKYVPSGHPLRQAVTERALPAPTQPYREP